MAITLGVDIGGTFTDFVWAEDGALRVLKLPTAPAQEEDFLAGPERLPMGKIRRIVHGTTVATNALLEGKWAATALITTAGFRDVLEIGRQNRPFLYDLFCDRPPPLVPREWRLEVPERLDARDRAIRPLDEEAVRELAAKIKAGGIQAVAVVFLFSFLNPVHERRVEKILREERGRGPYHPLLGSPPGVPGVRAHLHHGHDRGLAAGGGGVSFAPLRGPGLEGDRRADPRDAVQWGRGGWASPWDSTTSSP